VTVPGTAGGKFRAILVSITKVENVTEELMPFVSFRANIEKRELGPKDDVAVFNVHGTSSHFVVFLDPGKTAKDLEEELIPYNVVLTNLDWQRIVNDLEAKAQYKAVMDE
jgi:hypothetical protein